MNVIYLARKLTRSGLPISPELQTLVDQKRKAKNDQQMERRKKQRLAIRNSKSYQMLEFYRDGIMAAASAAKGTMHNDVVMRDLLRTVRKYKTELTTKGNKHGRGILGRPRY